MDKKGLTIYKDWAEILALTLLVIGFIAALIAGSKVMSYLIITICGLMFGRMWFRIKHTFRFPWFLIIAGFLVGYLLGQVYGSIITTILLFIVGIIISYYLHDQNKVKSVEY